MSRALARAAVLLALAAGAARAADAPEPDRARLAALVERLADPALGGRATPDERDRCAAILADEMRAAGLVPAPGRTDLLLPVKARTGVPAGRHVLGWRPGREEGAWVLVVAHYDGRPKVEGRVLPGADGNASGVAALVEAGRALAAGPAPRRGVLFAALDRAMWGREGSRDLAANPPLDLARCVAAVGVEHVGRSFGDAIPDALFVFGSAAGGVRRAASAVPASPGTVVRALGHDLCPLADTDVLAFEERGVPTAVVTAGPSADDGTPGDVAAKVDAAALAWRTRVLAAFVRALADAPGGAAEAAAPGASDDLPVLRDVLADLAARAEALGFSDVARRRARYAADFVGTLSAKARVSDGERAAARILALDVLGRLAEPR